jgi:hypothetical protein
MAGGSLAERRDAHQQGAARAGHPHAVALDGGVEIAAATVFLEEGVEVGEQVSVTLIAHTGTLLGGRHCVNVSDFRHYFPFGPRGSTVSGAMRVLLPRRLDLRTNAARSYFSSMTSTDSWF